MKVLWTGKYNLSATYRNVVYTFHHIFLNKVLWTVVKEHFISQNALPVIDFLKIHLKTQHLNTFLKSLCRLYNLETLEIGTPIIWTIYFVPVASRY